MQEKKPPLHQELEDLNKSITFLQDLVLKMKIQLDLLTQTKYKEDNISLLTITADEEVQTFLKHRPRDCHILEQCTTMIEKGALKILRVFTEKGPNAATHLLNTYIQNIDNAQSKQVCPDEQCLAKAMHVYEALKKLIYTTRSERRDSAQKLYDLTDNISSLDDIEKEYQLISPLSNEKRIKILKILSNGSLYYNQLEDNLGIKGGHFHFHLEKLLEADYITQKESKGPYSITKNGMRALEFLYDLKEEILF
jgi:DNA-binding transcriptional ArsR family regulator